MVFANEGTIVPAKSEVMMLWVKGHSAAVRRSCSRHKRKKGWKDGIIQGQNVAHALWHIYDTSMSGTLLLLMLEGAGVSLKMN